MLDRPKISRPMSSMLLFATAALLPAACTDSRSNPAAPNAAQNPSFSREHEGDDNDRDDRGFLPLVSVVGKGRGRMICGASDGSRSMSTDSRR